MSFDLYRGSSNVALPVEVSEEIWGATLQESAIMQLARRIPLPGTGTSIQIVAGEPAAAWVAETAAKPVANHTLAKKLMTPYKLAVIEPFSMEFARDLKALYAELVRRLPYALAKKFDETIVGGVTPGTGFDVLTSATAVSLIPAGSNTMYDQFVTVDGNISSAGGVMNGIALAPQGRSKVLAAQDGNGRPLFTVGTESGEINPILGAKVIVDRALYKAGSPDVVGIAGDWTKAAYGTVEGVKISISDQATLVDASSNTINLWQDNMIAVKAEIEVGFVVEDASYFNRLTGDSSATTTTTTTTTTGA